MTNQEPGEHGETGARTVPTGEMSRSRIRLAVIATHPIQYQAPLFRNLAARTGIDLRVFFSSRFGVETSLDRGFGASVRYDVPLTEGYDHEFLDNEWPNNDPAAWPGPWNPTLGCRLGDFEPQCVLIQGYARTVYALAAAYALLNRVPLILRGESNLIRPRPRWLQAVKSLAIRALVRQGAAILPIGRANRAFWLAHGALPEKLFFAPYSVDADWFARRSAALREESGRIRAQLSVAPGESIALFVGKFISRKRPQDLILALRHCRRPTVAVFVGSGAGEEQLRTIASQSAPGQVRFAGFVNQHALCAWYAAADCFVLPSEYETWGLVVNEAMACGTPAVVSDRVGCGADLVSGGGTGFVYPCGDVRALGRALEAVLSPGQRAARSSAARTASLRYGIAATADGIVAAARSVTAGS